MNDLDQNDNYSSFMVRFRRMHEDNQPTWVIFVQAIQTGQVVCFPRLDGLIEFLRTRFGDSVDWEDVNLRNESTIEEIEPDSGKHPSEDLTTYRPKKLLRRGEDE